MATTEAALLPLRRARTIGEVKAALEAAPHGPALQSALIQRYSTLAADARRDPAGQVRAELLRALRPLVTQADRERLETAVVTYEFGPHGENCAELRAAALLTLSDLDPDLAEVYAAHLLGDNRTETMSGEPALTAIRLLAARGAITPIYLFALKGGVGQEPLGEALRSLDKLPGSLVEGLAWRMLTSEDAVALVGLFDLLTAHAEPEVDPVRWTPQH